MPEPPPPKSKAEAYRQEREQAIKAIEKWPRWLPAEPPKREISNDGWTGREPSMPEPPTPRSEAIAIVDDWLCEMITLSQLEPVPAKWLGEPAYIEKYAATITEAVCAVLANHIQQRYDGVVARGLESESNLTEALTLGWVLALLGEAQ